jgi:uncharacterized RDD family membrane protein YckC
MARRSRAQISGYYAGPVSRLLAYLIDIFLSVTVFGLVTAGTIWAINTVFEVNIEWNWEEGVFGLVLMLTWLFLYFWLGFALNGKTVGYGILGIKVVSAEGSPITPGHAAIRVLVLPISVVSIVGVLGIIFDPKQRALHDFVAKTAVVYDWGDRPAELPSPLTNWLVKKGVDDTAPPEVQRAGGDSMPSQQ